jgi:hypothetical protein
VNRVIGRKVVTTGTLVLLDEPSAFCRGAPQAARSSERVTAPARINKAWTDAIRRNKGRRIVQPGQ